MTAPRPKLTSGLRNMSGRYGAITGHCVLSLQDSFCIRASPEKANYSTRAQRCSSPYWKTRCSGNKFIENFALNSVIPQQFAEGNGRRAVQALLKPLLEGRDRKRTNLTRNVFPLGVR